MMRTATEFEKNGVGELGGLEGSGRGGLKDNTSGTMPTRRGRNVKRIANTMVGITRWKLGLEEIQAKILKKAGKE